MTLDQLCLLPFDCWAKGIPEAEYLTNERWLLTSQLWCVDGHGPNSCCDVGNVTRLHGYMAAWQMPSQGQHDQEGEITWQYSKPWRIRGLPFTRIHTYSEISINPLCRWCRPDGITERSAPFWLVTTYYLHHMKGQAHAALGDTLNAHAKQTTAFSSSHLQLYELYLHHGPVTHLFHHKKPLFLP